MKKNVVNKIKELFSSNEEVVKVEASEEVATDESTELKFVEVKAADGRILRADDIAIDMPIMEITEDGEVALEDGEVALEDGTILVIAEGVITEIKEVEEEEAPIEEAPVDEVLETEVTEEVAEIVEETARQAKEIINETRTIEKYSAEDLVFMETVKTMVSDFASIKEELEAVKAENITLTERVNKFAGEPSAESTNTKVEFKTITKEDKLKFFGKK